MLREEWLNKAVDRMGDVLNFYTEREIPEVLISVGFPSSGGLGKKKRVIGQCWSQFSDGEVLGKPQIFVSPLLNEKVDVLGTILHELIHAVDLGQSGHRGDFAKMAKQCGFLKPFTSSTPGDELANRLHVIAEELGEYPHEKLTHNPKIKKQTTRMKKLFAEDCSCLIRVARKYIEIEGNFKCPHDNELIPQEDESPEKM